MTRSIAEDGPIRPDDSTAPDQSTAPVHWIRSRRLVRGLAVSLLVIAAAAGIWLAARPAPLSMEGRVEAVAATLRCPSCEGQSVAASQSDLAREMRQVIAQQLAAGQSPAQIRAWFAERYGNSVLLDPPASGPGLLAQLVPFVLLAAAAVIVARRIGGRRGLFAGVGLAVGVGAVLLAGLLPGLTGRPSAGSSSTAPRAVTAVGSDATRGALAALQAGRADDAERQARSILTGAAPGSRTWQDALLIVGLAQRERGDPAGTVTLQRFLTSAPGHPAAAAVRRLLGSR